jgi:hypothetical protein
MPRTTISLLATAVIAAALAGCQPQSHRYEIKVTTSPAGKFSGAYGYVGADGKGAMQIVQGDGTATYTLERARSVKVDLKPETSGVTLHAEITRDGVASANGSSTSELGGLSLSAD